MINLCKSSKLGTIALPDWFKGFILAAISVPVGIIVDNAQKYLAHPELPFRVDPMFMLAAAIVGGGSYLVKNILTGSGGQMFTNAPYPPPPPTQQGGAKNEKKDLPGSVPCASGPGPGVASGPAPH